MKKVILTLVVALVCLLAFSSIASAADVNFTPQDGKYSIDYSLADAGIAGTIKDGTMYSFVVIEAPDTPANFTLDESAIRYIDQGKAANGKLAFTNFIPMDLETATNKYLVYIGGEGLSTATKIGLLAVEGGTTPDPVETFDVLFLADGVQVAKITKNVGETLAFADFPAVPAKSGYTGVWNVTTDITSATTVTAVYTAVSTPDPDAVIGDMNGDGEYNDDDAIHLLFYYLIDETKYALSADGDVDSSGSIDDDDAIYLLFNYLIDDTRYPLYPNK